MAPLADMIARVRNDLHDNDAGNYRWTDAVLQRHVERAVKEYSFACPLEQRTTLTTTASSRDIDCSPAGVDAMPNLIYVEKVEFPTGNWPPSFARWRWWNKVLTLVVDDEPAAGEDVHVYWGKLHSITASATTIPIVHEDVIATGAAAYAALEWASYATNRINVGGDETTRHYLDWGNRQMAGFRQQLRALGRKGKLRQAQIHPG